MSAEPADWAYTGVIQMQPAGWQPPPGDAGCLAASLATLLGLRPALVRAAMGAPSIAAARAVVELWDPDYTLAYWEPEAAPLDDRLVISLWQGSGRQRERDASGRFTAAPVVHAAVLRGLSLYYDPHPLAWDDPPPLGYLGVVFRGATPAAATFPLEP